MCVGVCVCLLTISTHSDEDAVRMANDSKYALAGSVFSNSRDRAFKIARQIRGGTVLVNDFGIAYLCQELPFGGVGFSGFGKFNGPEGLRECCDQKVATALIPQQQSVEPLTLEP